MTPLPQLYRCPRHQVIVLEGKACTGCLQEKRDGVTLGPIRGERWESATGEEIKGTVQIAS